MNSPNPAVSPFAMLLDPEAVLAAMHRSVLLGRLQSRICRPLDRPQGPANPAEVADDAKLVDRRGDFLPGSPY
jgi:hypothetical protein